MWVLSERHNYLIPKLQNPCSRNHNQVSQAYPYSSRSNHKCIQSIHYMKTCMHQTTHSDRSSFSPERGNGVMSRNAEVHAHNHQAGECMLRPKWYKCSPKHMVATTATQGQDASPPPLHKQACPPNTWSPQRLHKVRMRPLHHPGWVGGDKNLLISSMLEIWQHKSSMQNQQVNMDM